MIWLVHDATAASAWVAHYAVRLAAHEADRRLRLVGDAPPAHLGDECRRAGVTLEVDPSAAIPDGAFVVCGLRGPADPLIRARRHHVLAVRVAHPGLLGHPRDVLLPIGDPARGPGAAGPWLRLFAADLERLHLLHVDRVPRLRFRLLSDAAAERRLRRGRAALDRAEAALAPLLPPSVRLDAAVVVSDDVPKELVIEADRLHARLLLLGAPRHPPPRRFAYGSPIEQVLREARADVAVCGAPA